MQSLSKYLTMHRLGIFAGLLLVSTLLMQFVWRVSLPDTNAALPTSEKINLALRRTAHLLLKEKGDSTSGIPAVLETEKNVWLLPLEHSFNYDSLPRFLQSSLALHGIHCDYDVAVLDCRTGLIALGYNLADLLNTQEPVPCGGREQQAACYNIRLTLLSKPSPTTALPWLLGAALALLLFVLMLRWQNKPKPVAADVSSPVMPDIKTEENNVNPIIDNQISEKQAFASFQLDMSNLLLISPNQTHKLTYREAKLLQLFVLQPNQVLERSFILDKVWGEEGIMVGRSLDMFVSRLRKLLREDAAVQILAVHGVGYRLVL